MPPLRKGLEIYLVISKSVSSAADKKANMLEELRTVNNHIIIEHYGAQRISLVPQLQTHTEGLHKGQSETWNGLKELRRN